MMCPQQHTDPEQYQHGSPQWDAGMRRRRAAKMLRQNNHAMRCHEANIAMASDLNVKQKRYLAKNFPEKYPSWVTEFRVPLPPSPDHAVLEDEPDLDDELDIKQEASEALDPFVSDPLPTNAVLSAPSYDRALALPATLNPTVSSASSSRRTPNFSTSSYGRAPALPATFNPTVPSASTASSSTRNPTFSTSSYGRAPALPATFNPTVSSASPSSKDSMGSKKRKYDEEPNEQQATPNLSGEPFPEPLDRYQTMLDHGREVNTTINRFMTDVKEVVDVKPAEGGLGGELRHQVEEAYRRAYNALKESREKMGESWGEIYEGLGDGR